MFDFIKKSSKFIYLVLMCSLIPLQVYATTPLKWSWVSDYSTVISSIPAVKPGDAQCPSGVYQKHFIEGELEAKEVCIMAGSTVRFGLYDNDYGSLVAVIGFGNDEKLYKVDFDCHEFGQCLYLPETDILVTRPHLNISYIKNLVIYKNFSKQLKPVFDPFDVATKYSFNETEPKYIYKSKNGFTYGIKGIGASNNGKWLAVEVASLALTVLNLDTYEMKRISPDGYTYDVGMGQVSELAVTNDGRFVAWMGWNARMDVYDSNDSCGDIATDYNISPKSTIEKPCPKKGFNTGSLISGFKYGSWPKFSDDGGELSFFAYSKDGKSNKVHTRAAGYSFKNLDYLAMGDSYSSGEGETESQYYIDGTNSEFEKCHTSKRSYPFVVSELYNRDPEGTKSVACSGAKTIDTVGSALSYWGQGDRLGLGKLNLSDLERTSYQSQALESFIPGRIHQNDFVEKYKPSTITIGIGGNDAGLMGKLTSCLSPGTCKWAKTDEGREKTAIQIKALFKILVNTYKKIQISSPQSKIYAIGYPKLFDNSGSCSGFVDFLFDKTERQFINDGILYLNQVVEAAANSVGIQFIDIYDSFGDNAICGSKESAVNTVKLGNDIGLFDNAKWFRLIGQESFHPNSLGHALTGLAIKNSAVDIFTDEAVTIAPTIEIAPEPPLSLLPSGYHDYPAQISANFVSERSEPSMETKIAINMPDYSFMPNSEVIIESDDGSNSSWSFNASSTGGLDEEITLSDKLTDYVFIFYMNGKSFSGEPIEISEVIKIWDINEPPEVTEDEEQVTPNTGGDDILDDENPISPDLTDEIIENEVSPLTIVHSDSIDVDPVAQIFFDFDISSDDVLTEVTFLKLNNIPPSKEILPESAVLGDSVAKVPLSVLDKSTPRSDLPETSKLKFFEPSWVICEFIILAIIIFVVILARYICQNKKHSNRVEK